MCAIPARVAGVERIALASPPGPDGELHPLVLAAAALCGVEEIYAMGGAQAIFALAHGTETIAPVDVIAGPGNAWVREAKRAVYGTRRDRLARRPLGADGGRRPRRRPRVGGARPLRPGRARRRQPAGRRRGRGARARRGRRGDRGGRRRAAERRRRAAGPGPGPRPRATRSTSPTPSRPSTSSCFEEDAALLAERVTTAGCVFAGRLRRDRLRRLRRRLQPRAADRRRRSLLRAARARRLPPPDLRPSRSPPRPRRRWRRTSTPSPAPRASPSTASQR